MSLYGMMRTSVSGMNAQANKLTSISDNISNSDTIGYKKAENEFLSLVQDNGADSYAAGGVISQVRYGISEQGTLTSTSSATDLAINGNGFFVVSDKGGQPYLTRAGSFVPDKNGNLVNAAGYYLMAYSTKNGAPNVVANGLQGMEVVKADATLLSATPSTAGTFSANLPSTTTAVPAANLPSANTANTQYSQKTSLVGYNDLGAATTLDVYMTKTSDNTWEMAVYDKSGASASGGFPYTSPALSTNTLTFDPSTGKLASGSPASVDIPVPNGSDVKLDVSNMTQLAANYSVSSASLNGNAPSTLDHVEISTDGNVSSIFSDGTRTTTYKIPLVNVASPDSLTPESGNVYSLSNTSGDPLVGFAGSSGLGEIKSSNLEQSTVDLASELTNMIEAQRGYTANSKVFQTGAELLDVLVNLKT